MKNSEKIAYNFLKQSFPHVQYEPKNNQPPDFLCNNEIAVEVMLLDQVYTEGDKHQELQTIEVSLRRTLERIYKSFTVPPESPQWFVHHEFSRPIPRKREIIKFAQSTLKGFNSDGSEEQTFKLENFKISIGPSSLKGTTKFIMGGWVDHDSGGWMQSELTSNITRCLEEKSKKIQINKSLYKTWWLILIDNIGLAQTKPSMEGNLEYQKYMAEFQRVLLLSKIGTNYIDLL